MSFGHFSSTLVVTPRADAPQAIFQTCCRFSVALGIAIITLIRQAIQQAAEGRGVVSTDADLLGIEGAFWAIFGFIMAGECRCGERMIMSLYISFDQRVFWSARVEFAA